MKTIHEAIYKLNPSIVFINDEKAFDINGNQVEYDFVAANTLFEQNKYSQYRLNEYPPITDYLDGVVKGDQDQINKYIADCQAVKAKYPKGS